MKKGLLSLCFIAFAALLMSCGNSLNSAADIDKALGSLEQVVQESENLSKSLASGDFNALTKLPELAVKFQENYNALKAAESKMTPEQKEKLESLVQRFNEDNTPSVGDGEGNEDDTCSEEDVETCNEAE